MMNDMPSAEREQMLLDFKNTLMWAKTQLSDADERGLADATQGLINAFEVRLSIAQKVVYLNRR